jgi:signal transduction histidine kinase
LEQQSASLQRANRKLREEIQAVKESERRRGELEGRLLESERLESLGHLAGGIAHDFNNMLAVVMSNAELMDELDPDQEECREQIILVSQQAAELCNQMLMVSGGGSVDIQVHNLNDIVGNLKSLLESTVQPLRLELELDSSRALPVEVDRSQITQLVLNLVTNAADAARTEKGSDVRLATGLSYFSEAKLEAARCIDGRPTSGDYVWLSVVDEGAGIDSETRRRSILQHEIARPWVGVGNCLARSQSSSRSGDG